MGRFDGKVAFITGAGQGIGLGIGLALATEGADIAIAEVEADRAEKAAEEIRQRGVRALVAVCDIRFRDQVDRAVAATVAEFGRIDILVNNAINTGSDPALAASGGRRPFVETTEELMRLQWESGALGTFHCMQACYPHLRGKDASIVNLASRAGTDGIAGYTAYASTKEAIRALSRVASREWGADGIRVNVVCPHARTPAQQKFAEANPGIEDELVAHVPLGRLGDAELDIGGAVLMLSSPDARYVTGQTIMVNGGA